MWNVCGVENVMWRMFVVWNVYGGECDVRNVCGVENVICGMFVVWRM